MLALIDAPIPSLFVSTPIEFMPLIIVDPPAAPFATLSLRRNIGSVASSADGITAIREGRQEQVLFWW